jgi:hypothetical protein
VTGVRDVREALVHISGAVVELCRASALLDSRSNGAPPLPEFYETNRAIRAVESLRDRLKPFARLEIGETGGSSSGPPPERGQISAPFEIAADVVPPKKNRTGD